MEEMTILENFMEFYKENGKNARAVVDFIASEEEKLAKVEENGAVLDENLRDEMAQFYDYFAFNFGDDSAVMELIETKWQSKPPVLLLFGSVACEFERGQKEKYRNNVVSGSKEESNICELAAFIAEGDCRVSIIAEEETSGDFNWPMEIAFPDLTNLVMPIADPEVLKGMLTDFLTSDAGMIIRRFGSENEKDRVYGFTSNGGSVTAMEADALTFSLSAQKSETMQQYLEAIDVLKADINLI